MSRPPRAPLAEAAPPHARAPRSESPLRSVSSRVS
jgi:hypothetical protein